MRFFSSLALTLALAGGAQASSYGFENFQPGDPVNAFSALGANVSVTTISNGSVDQAIIFDTRTPTGGDTDLAGPFFDVDGNRRTPNRVLIIAENTDFSDPDDEAAGGEITFKFDRAVDLLGFDVFDDIRMTATSNLGQSIGVSVPGDNMWARVRPNWFGIREVRFSLTGSGAIDNIRFDVSAPQSDPAPVDLPPAAYLGLSGLLVLLLLRGARRTHALVPVRTKRPGYRDHRFDWRNTR